MLAALKTALKRGPSAETAEPASDETRDDAPFRVVVTEGAETCFSQSFLPGEVVVGGSPDCDIVIADVEEDEVASLRLERIGAAGLVTLVALSEGVSARGRDLAPGKPVIFPDRALFTVAGYRFEVAHAPGKTPVAQGKSLPALLVAGSILLGAAAILAGGGGSPAPPEASEPPLKSTLVEGAIAPAQRLQSAEAELRMRLVAANLMPPARVERDGPVLVVRGRVNPDERARAFEVVSLLRARVDTPIEISLETEGESAFIRAVVLKPETYIIGADGRRYAVGQRLPDGGIVASVDEETVVIDRGGVKERIVYVR